MLTVFYLQLTHVCAMASTSEKATVKRVRNDYEEEEDGKPKKIPRTLVEKTTEKRLIIVLENASLETVKVSTSTGEVTTNVKFMPN